MSIKPRKVAGGYQARYRDINNQLRIAGVFVKLKEAEDARDRASVAVQDERMARTQPKVESKNKKSKTADITLTGYAPLALTVLSKLLTPGTMDNHQRSLRLHILPTFGDKLIRSIKTYEVDDWWASMPEEGWAKASYFTLSRVMRLAEKQGQVKRTPCRVEGASKDVSKQRPALARR